MAAPMAVPTVAASVAVFAVAVLVVGLAVVVPVEHGDTVGFEAEVAG